MTNMPPAAAASSTRKKNASSERAPRPDVAPRAGSPGSAFVTTSSLLRSSFGMPRWPRAAGGSSPGGKAGVAICCPDP